MSTSSFDRPLVLTEKGAKKLFELLEKWEKDPPEPDGIEPYSDEDRAEVDELLKKVFRSSEGSPKE